MDRHLSPAETARRFGVSIKALRLYEQRGLLAPRRTRNGSTGAGWRSYGPDQIARLHQILTLKRLGLSLARIGELLAGSNALEAVLALQEEALAKDAARLARVLGLVKVARAKLKAGQALSIDDLATLNQETVMTRLDAKQMRQVLTPFADRHLSANDKEAIREKIGDRDKMAETVNGLMVEAQPLMEIGDHTSDAAQDLARRWRTTVQPFPIDDQELVAKIRASWNDAMNDPSVAEKMAVNRDILGFVGRAVAHLKEQAK